MTREVHYFEDPNLDKAVGLIMQLASEVHVLTQRLHALEAALARKGALDAGTVDAFVPDEGERERFEAMRDTMVARLLRVLTEDGPAEHPLRDELVRAPSAVG